MKKESIQLTCSDAETERILKWADKNIAQRVQELNEERVRISGIQSSQRQPLPPLAEKIRAFFLRISRRRKKPPITPKTVPTGWGEKDMWCK